MDRKKERVLSFFDVEIGQFILGDLDVLAHIRPHPSTQSGGCTVPQAMLIFTALDLLGFLVDDDPNARKTNTAKNYQAIFSSDLGFFQKNTKPQLTCSSNSSVMGLCISSSPKHLPWENSTI